MLEIEDDVFREQYKSLSEEQKDEIYEIKQTAKMLLREIHHSNMNAREMDITIKKLEEVVMWATKGITK